MEIRLFDLKKDMIYNEESMIDFLDSNIKVNYISTNLIIRKVMLVQEQHLCRIDLLTYDAYDNVNYIDILMKFNQISNPFSMEINDFIIVPTIDSAQLFLKKSEESNLSQILDTKSLFIDPTRASKKDIKRIEQLQKLASNRVNGAKEIIPTNLLREGEVPFKTDGISLTFAP